MGRFRLMVATVGAMLIGTVASAQNSTVNGRVTDVRGGVIANADVTLRLIPAPGAPVMPNMPGMNEQTTRSGADGAFTFNQVAAGQYVLQADRPGYGRVSQAITVPGPNLTFTMALEALDVPGAEAPAAPAGEAVDTQALLDRIKVLEQKIGELESSTVLSDPETRVRRVEVYVDESGNQSDVPSPGATPQVTYQR